MQAGRPPALLIGAGSVTAALVLMPLAVTAVDAAKAAAQSADLLLRPLVGTLLVNTLLLVACAGLASGGLGLAAAWFVERTTFPGRRAFAVLAAVPLAMPPFISSFAWLSLDPALEGFGGALLVVTLSYYPLVYLPVAAALREMDPALEETAAGLGNGPLTVFRRVVLPQLRPALLGGVLLVALNTLVEFGAFALLRFRTFTTAIYGAYRAGFSGAEPALLAMVLVALCILCLVAEQLVRGGARYGRLARGTRRAAVRAQPGPWRLAISGGFALLAIFSLGVPLAMIGYWLAQPAPAATATVAASAGALAAAAWSSCTLAGGGAAITLILAFPLGMLAARYDGWLVALLERAAYLTQSVPGVVVALALVTLTVHHLRPLYQSSLLLMLAYAAMFLPMALVAIRSALVQAQPRLAEAGRSLGLGRASVLLRITLPLAAPGLGAAAAMVFIAIATELTATLLLAPIGTRTLATELWADTSTLAFAACAPYAAAMTGMSLAASWTLARRFGAGSVFAPRLG
ncbi:MAG: iron ABC transporter permease [Rhodospirillales bacterium 20-64-7]|nr:MAG: iron ABC transporter permease [Rhodospirillales bacterium 20-64-7]